ncbi:hypothetical protein FOWG_04838 [Fusarium oxysporum f. sp. lycopersici MN25]|nr:hypothetical protein FOWG_04838 [Fusarium oxysporum f. sp. lycopersici MN25]
MRGKWEIPQFCSNKLSASPAPATSLQNAKSVHTTARAEPVRKPSSPFSFSPKSYFFLFFYFHGFHWCCSIAVISLSQPSVLSREAMFEQRLHLVRDRGERARSM